MNSKENKSLDKLNKMLAVRSKKEVSRLEEELLNLKFVAAIEDIMEQKGINQTQLSEMLESSKSYVSQLFSGYKMLNIRTLSKIQKSLGITFKVDIIDNQRTAFENVNCEFHKRISIKDLPGTDNDKPYILKTLPKSKDKIPA